LSGVSSFVQRHLKALKAASPSQGGRPQSGSGSGSGGSGSGGSISKGIAGALGQYSGQGSGGGIFKGIAGALSGISGYGSGGGNGAGQASRTLLMRGCVGLDVAHCQRLLNAKESHTPPLIVDGIFGPKTERKVREFQIRRGLACDGIIGPATLKALQS
jgi:peptidoglycan hydrolase-like protein with peptidoglycan-binding domain